MTAIALAEDTGKRLQAAAPLNAALHWSQALLDREARRLDESLPGSLTGTSVALKDNLVTLDHPTTCGSRILEGYISPFEATAVRRLRAAGAMVAAKANLDEFAMGSSTEHSAFGRVLHPLDPERVPGGSSGGSAALVAADVTTTALGSETGGSVRQPASFCGVVGIKPSYGRVSRFGLVAFGSSLDCISTFGRSTAAAGQLLCAISGHDPLDATTRDVPPLAMPDKPADLRGVVVGLPREYFPADLHPGVRAGCDRAIAALKRLGAEIREVSLPHTRFAVPTYYIVNPAEAAANLARFDGVRFGPRHVGPEGDVRALYRATRGIGFGPEVRRRILVGTFVLSAGYSDQYYSRAQAVRRLIIRDFDQVFATGVDLLFTPTTPTPAFKAGEKTADPVAMYLADIFVCPASLAGLPALSLPVGRDQGLPIGGQLMAGDFNESAMLGAAMALEAEARSCRRGSPVNWQTVIGLEVHVQLATRTKMFCGCATGYGEAPNTNVCPVCLGLPGALPTPNAEAVRLGVLGALALGCEIHPTSIFARKNYFYPDLPKGYQISQFDRPLATGGTVEMESPDRGPIAISITRLHLEEDAGKSLHDRIPGHTAVDLNRAGTPLAEIVSGPDLQSPAEARAYLVTLRQLLVYAGVSECSMEKGSLRVDANLSIRRAGEPLGTKTEVKNMNSFANVERALESERARQIGLLEAGAKVTQVTLTFNAATGAVKPLRTKEDSHDYRYFPDPDLPPLVLEPDWIEAQQANLAELPAARRSRYERDHGLTAYDARVLTQEPAVAGYFELVVDAGVDAKTAANWVMGEVLAGWNEARVFAVEPQRLAVLIGLVDQGTVSLQAAKRIYGELTASSEAPLSVAERLGLIQVRDANALVGWVDDVLAAYPAEVARYRGGETKLAGFFVGQVMKKSAGKADPKAIQPILLERLGR